MASAFVISLDFELMWGVRDHLTKDEYGRNVLGVRQAIPRMLDAFERRAIRATWAAVGLLFCESRDEIAHFMPAARPAYREPRLSNYAYLDEVGADERSDPYYFGMSLVRLIEACPGQEIGTHTFSHFYCLEPGPTDDDFEADLRAAIAVAAHRGIALRSIAFPRNQYDDGKLAVCARNGLVVYRGNERHWLYRPSAGDGQTLSRRALRLADAYLPLTGPHVSRPRNGAGEMTNVPSSRFLRPYSARLRGLDGLRLRRIVAAMEAAARSGATFHLWWHPHNFGRNLDENMRFLEAVLDRFAELRESHGMQSRAMGDFDARAAI